MTVFTLTCAVLALAAAGGNPTVLHGIRAGRLAKAERAGVTAAEMLKLRSLFDAAEQKLRSVLAGR